MHTTIEVFHPEADQYEFRVTFTNDTGEKAILPAQQLQRAAARVGLTIGTPTGALDAIEFEIINYANRPEEVVLEAGASLTLPLMAELKKIGKSSWVLCFKGATYKVEPNYVYEVGFSFNGYRSEVIKWSFSEK